MRIFLTSLMSFAYAQYAIARTLSYDRRRESPIIVNANVQAAAARCKARIGTICRTPRPTPKRARLLPMKVEEIAEAVAKLAPDELARFRRWFTAFDAGHANHAEQLDSTATKLGRFAGRAFAELRKRAKDGGS